MSFVELKYDVRVCEDRHCFFEGDPVFALVRVGLQGAPFVSRYADALLYIRDVYTSSAASPACDLHGRSSKGSKSNTIALTSGARQLKPRITFGGDWPRLVQRAVRRLDGRRQPRPAAIGGGRTGGPEGSSSKRSRGRALLRRFGRGRFSCTETLATAPLELRHPILSPGEVASAVHDGDNTSDRR